MPVLRPRRRGRPRAGLRGRYGGLRRLRGGGSARPGAPHQASSADLLQVDAVLGNDNLQILRVAAEVAAPLVDEYLGLAGVCFKHYAHLVLFENYGMLREPSTTDRVAAVDRVARPEALNTRRRGVEFLGDPIVPPSLVDPAPDLGCVRL